MAGDMIWWWENLPKGIKLIIKMICILLLIYISTKVDSNLIRYTTYSLIFLIAMTIRGGRF